MQRMKLSDLNKVPLQYQRGWTEFYKLKFNLTRDVLIPRPETELLVDEVIYLVRNELPQASILDLGTGSGCIAISLAKNLPHINIIATDISTKALEVAKENAKLHGVEDKIFFLASDLLPDFKTMPDIIVANLPYIPSARLKLIDPMVADFEPRIALDGGYDGFEIYRKLINQIASKKIYPKYLIAEIDSEHADIAKKESQKLFPEAKIEIKKDLAKMDRILLIKF